MLLSGDPDPTISISMLKVKQYVCIIITHAGDNRGVTLVNVTAWYQHHIVGPTLKSSLLVTLTH